MGTKRSVRFVLFSQLSLVTTTVVLLLLNPAALSSQSGISYWGNFLDTFVPYMVGLGLVGYFLWRAAGSLPHAGHQADMIRLSLRVSAMALAGIIITPSLASNFTGFWHGTFAALMFFTQLAVTWRLFRDLWNRLFERILIVLQVVSVVLIVLSFRWFGLFDVMIPAQVVAAWSFALLCVRIIIRMERRESVNG